MLSGDHSDKHGDCLSGVEAHAVASTINDKHRCKTSPQGPVRALHDALEWFNWTMPRATMFVDDINNELDMSIGTPAMLKALLIASFDRKRNKRIIAARSSGCCTGNSTNWVAL